MPQFGREKLQKEFIVSLNVNIRVNRLMRGSSRSNFWKWMQQQTFSTNQRRQLFLPINDFQLHVLLHSLHCVIRLPNISFLVNATINNFF